ncbi:MAG: DUF1015 domain-containing protein [Syntrophobacterales bacterium]|jgi:uncharacterized protein (DUF1015 family)
MPEIAPLKGLLYNQKLIGRMDQVITPPFDVISPEEQEMYHKRHPYNMIRLILGQQQPGDNEENNWYVRAAEALEAWQSEGVLIRDSKLAFYDYEIRYQESPDVSKTRQGFLCLVKLHKFSQGSVLPHERTYEATKSERLKLMLACNANLSQVFALYPDPTHIVKQSLHQGREQGPVLDFTDSNGIHHRMWRVTSAEVIQKVVEYMRDKPLYIADGHHRYETALNYQKIMQQRYPERGERASYNYVFMYLADMHQEGLSILPTHRMFVQLPQFRMDSFLARAADYFEVERFPFDEAGRSQALREFLAGLYSAGDHHYLGIYESGAGQFVLLKLRDNVGHASWLGQLEQPLQKLDVVVLTELVLKHLLEVDENTLDDESKIKYRHDALKAVEEVDRGLFQVAFLLNHTKMEQLQNVANDGLFMPHKSTYFYPKVIDGSVINLLDPNEDVRL